MNIIWLQITSLIYMSILMIIYFFKKRIKNSETKLFGNIIIINEIGLLIEIGCFFTVPNKELIPVTNYIVTRLLLVYYVIYVLLFTFYLLMVVRDYPHNVKEMNSVKRGCFIYFLINTLFIFALPMDYMYDEQVIYSYGQSVDFLFISYTMIIIIWCAVLIAFRKKVKEKSE